MAYLKDITSFDMLEGYDLCYERYQKVNDRASLAVDISGLGSNIKYNIGDFYYVIDVEDSHIDRAARSYNRF